MSCLFLKAEPSAFELQSGATKKELKTLQSSNKNIESIIADLQNKVISLQELQDGLKSLFEGQTLKIKSLLDTALSHENSIKSLQSLQELHSNTLKQQSDLLELLKQQVQNNQKSIKTLDKKITDMGELLSQINAGMLNQLNLIKKNLELPTSDSNITEDSKNPVSKTPDTKNSKNTSKSSHLPVFQKDISKQKEIFEDAKKLYSQKNLEGAKLRLQWLVETKYQVAYSLYLLGEIAYKQKKYQDAIGFYKKSVLSNDKANYMPVLLWHTAWAFRYLKDLTNYNKFLDSLIYLYPNSEQAQKAKENRMKIKEKNE
ncbi:tetratricopeptide repeat protein [Helicobacter sp. 11S03491-1]|uniref:tetratricopeptide repeat protein n=1 Tax=Helicobacter sp. 11S03491-1 TaxID=1476196 RepID=UPI0015D9E84F|nr:tetratricopeptide repeat protein [Helicobacter sp. 11S03491-1]